MEEIKEKSNNFIDLLPVILFCVVITTLLCLASVFINCENSKELIKLNNRVEAISYNVRGLDYSIKESTSTTTNVKKLVDDYQALKRENEILLDKIQFYREKYEKMP